MKALLLLLGSTILLLSGCGAPTVWYKPGIEAATAHRDLGECRMKAAYAPVTTTQRMSGLGAFMSANIAQNNFVDACMLEKGYQPVSGKTVTNAAAWPEK